MKRPLIVAHRGYPSKAIENTIESFQFAFESGADFIEGDFWLTKDDEIVCIHDEDLVRVTNKTIAIRITDAKLNLIKSVNFYDERFNQRLIVPTIEEIITIIPPNKGLFFEVKDQRLKIIEVLKLKLERLRFPSELLKIISYHPQILKYSKTILPGIKTYLIFDWFLMKEKCKNKIVLQRFLQLLTEINCDGIDLNYSSNINEEFVKKIKQAGFEICVYDVNNDKALIKTINLNVDFITTDYPDLMQEILNKIRN